MNIFKIMREQLITFETAKLARKKGFYTNTHNLYDWIEGVEIVPQTLLQKWLKDKHNIEIAIMPVLNPDNSKSYYIFKRKLKSEFYERFDTYEEALESRLIEALNTI